MPLDFAQNKVQKPERFEFRLEDDAHRGLSSALATWAAGLCAD
jgi:hypothetical protein